MRRDDDLDVWLTTRMHGCALVYAALTGQQVDLADLTRAQLADLARWLAAGLAQATCIAHQHDHNAACEAVAAGLDVARADLAAIAEPIPDHIPAAWCGDSLRGCLVRGVWVSVALAAPARSCVDCAGALPYGPPWLMCGRGEALCAACATARGYGGLAERVDQARAALAAAADDDERVAIARDLFEN